MRPSRATKLLKVDRIDFDKQMLLAVSGGPLHGDRQTIEVLHLNLKDHALKVQWRVATRLTTTTDPLFHPVCLVLLERFDGKLVFDQPMEELN